ncbi:MAG: hypothetical protein E7408_00030 [Ruminococcaceae bacterium]|nr:hypothetical protein [Oscillospiraceae bacterium]
MNNFHMRGDFMRMVKSIMKLMAIITIIASLFGCSAINEPQGNDAPQVLDKTGMVYKDADYRSIYANVFDFDHYDGQPYFAVAFLGYGDRMDFRHTYVEGIFKDLGDSAIGQVGHIDFDGDEWYLIVPRYKEDVDILNLDTGDVHTIYNGEAFTVRCNLSDLHPNIEISTEQNLSGHKFSPQIGGDGKLVPNPDVWDITDYTVMEEN